MTFASSDSALLPSADHSWAHSGQTSRVPLTAQERLAKRHAIRRYRTQTGRITDDPHGFALTTGQIAAFSRPAEILAAMRR